MLIDLVFHTDSGSYAEISAGSVRAAVRKARRILSSTNVLVSEIGYRRYIVSTA